MASRSDWRSSLDAVGKLMARVVEKSIRESSFFGPDLSSFRRQESTFVVFNLFMLAVLLLLHTLFSSIFGTPPGLLIAVLALGFFLYVLELICLQGVGPRSASGAAVITWSSITLNMFLAFSLASLSYRPDMQYFALLVPPILQAAFRFSLSSTVAVVLGSTALEFFWVWNYFRSHPPAEINEYIEAATFSLIFSIVGGLVWVLVNSIRSKETDLRRSLIELEQTKERLLTEEKLAAVGRFSSAIAHEIRNPVAMISSALSTGMNQGLTATARKEMFEIAAKEASRLEKLTTDFLSYARPKPPDRRPADIAESVLYIADICRLRAAEKSVTIDAASDELPANCDAAQVQQALLNIMVNAVEAASAGGVVRVRGRCEAGLIRVDIEDGDEPIPKDVVEHIFEPFFTTKPAGTGLGLAIARNIAHGNGGDLVLSRNQPGSVQFSLTLPAQVKESEQVWAES